MGLSADLLSIFNDGGKGRNENKYEGELTEKVGKVWRSSHE
jgi:hypothetical protein